MSSEDRRSKPIKIMIETGRMEDLTERDVEQPCEEEFAALEEPLYDPEILREVIDLSDLPPSHRRSRAG